MSPQTERIHPTPERVLQLGMSFWGAKTLLSAIELNLFTILGAGPLGADAIAAKLNLHTRSARDFLDALVALGMLAREKGLYSGTEETSLFLDRNKPSYVGGLLEMANTRLYPAWGLLTTALQTGEPQNPERKQGDESPFEALYADPARLRQFLSAMTGVSMGCALAIAAKFPWSDYKTFAHIGCAQGCLPVQVALANPHLQGTGFDLEPVGPIFLDYAAQFGLTGRLTFQQGSFFTDPLPSVDVIVMGHILYDWDLETKKMLLRKAYEALPRGGSLIVYEALIDDDRRQNVFGLLMSLNMLIETPGGFDYTGADCAGWMKEAGFATTRVEHLVGPDSMVVAIK